MNVLKNCYSEDNQYVFDHTSYFIYNLPFCLVFSISCINETVMNADEIILKFHLCIHHRVTNHDPPYLWISFCKQIAMYGILVLHDCT